MNKMVLLNSDKTCLERCGSNLQEPEQKEILELMSQLNINDCTFAYDDVIHTNNDLDVQKLFSQTSYGYMLSGLIDNEITKLFIDIKTNKKLMKNMSPEVIYLLNISTCSIKQLLKYMYMLYICKFLSINGGTRCKNIDHFKYTSLVNLNCINIETSISDELRSSEVAEAYIGFTRDILVKKYYYFLIEKLDKIEKSIIKSNYENVEILMTELQLLIKNIIHYNVLFIIELNNYFYNTNCGSPIFYVNDRMVTFYYGDIQLNYIAWLINYIAPKSTSVRLQNRLERSMLHYYENIKEKVIQQTDNEVKVEDV